jgi:hypothetical protein
MFLGLTLLCSHEGSGEGYEEEVNVDVHQLPRFPLLLFTHFPPFPLRARHTTHHSAVTAILFARLRRFTTLGHVNGLQVVVYL